MAAGEDRRVISASVPRSSATDHERTGSSALPLHVGPSSQIYVIADDSAAKLKTQSMPDDEPLFSRIP